MPAKRKHSGDPFYALYVQATRLREASQTTRRQWMAFPPLPEDLASKVGLTTNGTQLVFRREQPTLENRVKWKWDMVPTELFARDLPERLAALEAANENYPPDNQWKISPPIVCQVTLSELASLIKSPSTPWFALKRFEKVARRQGISI